MKKALLFCLLAAGLFSLYSQNSDVDYVEGWVDLKDSRGGTYELFAGDRVVVGDTVITGKDGLAELVPQAGSRIVIKPGTVFSIQERQVKGQTRTAVSVTLGEIAFKFDKMTGNEPDIMTASATCGIRGTEFTVYAGADGSSMIIVDSGAVEVEARGEAVLLNPEEGVEVRTGEKPSEKFQVLRGKMDFSAWNQGREDEMLADPLAALEKMAIQLRELMDNVEEFREMYEEQNQLVLENRELMRKLREQGKDEEVQSFYLNTLRPMEVAASDMVLNYRYYALSAKALRRHVMTGLYVRMKTRFIVTSIDPLYQGFLENYNKLLDEYETRIVPRLVDADI